VFGSELDDRRTVGEMRLGEWRLHQSLVAHVGTIAARLRDADLDRVLLAIGPGAAHVEIHRLADPHRFTLFAARDLEPRVVVVGKVLGVLELREAGFVEATVDAQRRLYRLKPEALLEIEAWLAPFRRLWSAHVDALERHLDRMDRKPAAKRKTRKKK
jgi:DNA-binding transcriptional ArsR family regulator